MTIAQYITLFIAGPFALIYTAMLVAVFVRPHSVKDGFGLFHAFVLVAAIGALLIAFLGVR